MKAFKILTVLALSFIMFSCGSDDNNSTNTIQNLIIGKWYRESTEDASGSVTDDSSDCLFIEFTNSVLTYSQNTGDNCTEESSSESVSYVINAFDIYVSGNPDIAFKVVQLDDVSMMLRVFTENENDDLLDTITFSKVE